VPRMQRNMNVALLIRVHCRAGLDHGSRLCGAA
jgi:hypothetical protein